MTQMSKEKTTSRLVPAAGALDLLESGVVSSTFGRPLMISFDFAGWQ